MTEKQYLWEDLVALIPLSIMMSWTGSNPKLTDTLPIDSPMKAPVLISVIGLTLIELAFQVFYLISIQKQPFYFKPKLVGEYTIAGTNIMCYETAVLFWVSNYQYLATAVAFSVAKPFRKQIWTNWPYTVAIIGILGLNTAVLWVPYVNELAEFFLLAPFELISHDGLLAVDYFTYRYCVLLGIIINTAVTFVWERVLIAYLEKEFEKLEKEMQKFKINLISLN